MEFLEMKIIISEIKNSLKGISCRLYFAEEKIGEVEDITIETIQTKAKGGKKTEKYGDSVICEYRAICLPLQVGTGRPKEWEKTQKI